MRGYKGTGSGFGWDDKNKVITCDTDIWSGWLLSHPSACGLRGKPCPYFEDWCAIFGKDRANGDGAEGFEDAVENIERKGMMDSTTDMFFGEDGVNWTQMDDIEAAYGLDGQENVEANTNNAAGAHATTNVNPTIGATNSNVTPEASSRKRKTRNKSESGDEILQESLDKIISGMMDTRKEFSRIADYFDGEARTKTLRT